MFWDNFVRLCNKVGKYPNTVAAEVGVKSTGTVTGWKNGAKPRQSILKKLCDYFGVTEADLMGDDSAQKEKPTAQGGELTEKDVALVKWFRSLPEEKLRAILVSQDAPEELFD